MRVDVIIPCHQYGRYLCGCVRSVLRHQGLDLRVLIIDDNSTDDTGRIASALASGDSRVEVRRHTVRRGHIATYNSGLEWVNAEYMLLLSADDILTPGALNRAVEVMESNPEVGLTYGWHLPFRGEQDDLAPPSHPPFCGYCVVGGRDFLEFMCGWALNIVPTPTAVVRTAVQRRVGAYKEDLPHAGDMEMWMRFAVHSSIGIVNTYQAFYRIHKGNMSSRYDCFSDLKQRKDAFDMLSQVSEATVASGLFLQNFANRRLAMEGIWRAKQAFEDSHPALANDLIEFARTNYSAISWHSFTYSLNICANR